MKGIPQGRYTMEFRQEAVKLVTEEKLSLPEAARRLSLAPSTINYWVKAFKAGKLGEIGKGQRPLTDVEMELARMKKEWPAPIIVPLLKLELVWLDPPPENRFRVNMRHRTHDL